ncbi:LysR family transcriptional regulator [[Clostridium] dakarense]|uniref:LysR family transcriptional regulator n=1 Tax=Faecalimicrobium dakarense TaxID=1301100 RepID=UPI0004BAF7E5|nr:LysR family transcriptional regulator [[Clostridium] dakarense]
MNFNYLSQFVDVVKLGSISKAAEKNHISQSALSQQIKLMEQFLDSTLLERSNKGVSLTPQGNIVYKQSLQIITLYNKMLQDIEKMQNQDKVLEIFSTASICDYALPCTLYHIKKKYPQITIKLSNMSSQLIEEHIACGHGTIGFISGKPKNKSLISKKIFSDRICLVAGSDMNVPANLSKERLYDYPIIMLDASKYIRHQLDQYLKKIDIDISKLKILYSLDSIESIKSSSIRGFGLGFLPYMTIKKELYNKQLKIIEIDDFKLDNNFYTITKPLDDSYDKELYKLINYIEKTISKTIC